MSTNPTQLFEKLKTLPASRLAEVEDFVDFLTTKDNKRAALDSLLTIAPALEAAGVAPLSKDEIMAEVKAVRSERRARRDDQQAQPFSATGIGYQCGVVGAALARDAPSVT